MGRGRTFAAFSAMTAAESPSAITCIVEYGIEAGFGSRVRGRLTVGERQIQEEDASQRNAPWPCGLVTLSFLFVGNEKPLRKVIEVAAPGLAVVAVVVHVPDVGDVVLLQIGVNALGNTDQAVLVAAGKIEQLQLLARGGGVGHKFGGRFGVGRGRKPADPRKRVEVLQAEVERLAAAHRETGERALLAIRAGRILRLNGGNQTVEQVALELREALGVLRREGLVRRRRAVVRERATVGHHDDHRRRLSGGDEVVNDRVGVDVTAPFPLVAADAVQQVEHGIFPVGRVMRRKINDRFAPRAGDGGIVFKHFGASRDSVRRRLVETRGRIGKRAHVIRREHDGPAKVGARALRRNLFGFFLRECCPARCGENDDDRGQNCSPNHRVLSKSVLVKHNSWSAAIDTPTRYLFSISAGERFQYTE